MMQLAKMLENAGMKSGVAYASSLMKGWEVRQACKEFREQEAKVRRQQFHVVQKGA